MFDHQLFLGFFYSCDFQSALSALEPSRAHFFVNDTRNEDTYLQKIMIENTPYLGKRINQEIITLDELEALSEHINSIAKKLVPHLKAPLKLSLLCVPKNDKESSIV